MSIGGPIAKGGTSLLFVLEVFPQLFCSKGKNSRPSSSSFFRVGSSPPPLSRIEMRYDVGNGRRKETASPPSTLLVLSTSKKKFHRRGGRRRAARRCEMKGKGKGGPPKPPRSTVKHTHLANQVSSPFLIKNRPYLPSFSITIQSSPPPF